MGSASAEAFWQAIVYLEDCLVCDWVAATCGEMAKSGDYLLVVFMRCHFGRMYMSLDRTVEARYLQTGSGRRGLSLGSRRLGHELSRIGRWAYGPDLEMRWHHGAPVSCLPLAVNSACVQDSEAFSWYPTVG